MTETLTAKNLPALSESNNLWAKAKEAMHHRRGQEAESLYKQAIEKRIASMGENDHTVSQLLDELGALYLIVGRIEPALEQFKRALALLEKNFYAGHYYLGPVVEHLGDCAAKESKWEEAETQYKRALEIFDKTLSADHRSVLITQHKYATVLRKLGKYTDAETVINKGLKTIDSPLGPAEEFRFELALLYQAQDKNAEAEAQYKLAIEGFRQRRNMPRLGTCLQNFAILLKKQGRENDAKAMQDLSDKFITVQHGYEDSEAFFPSTILRA
ncbi:MAG: tetratricopeptide repeat protein [Candidatus Melainabacteria bacterium]|nr:tetratricopeptide repeat protein [Candidatus Melainabacteria bacterium]